jgi:hypothetical protein
MILNPSDVDHILNSQSNIEELKLFAEALNENFLESINRLENTNSFKSEKVCSQEIHPYLSYRNDMIEKPKSYIIGTFPPASYLRSLSISGNSSIGSRTFYVDGVEVPALPLLNFYHGNRNSFWTFLEISPLKIESILDFLKFHNWAYSDIIYSCSRTNISSSRDQDLKNIVPNFDLINEIMENEEVSDLWFTSSGTYNSTGIDIYRNSKIKTNSGQAYNLFLRTLQSLDYDISVRVNEDKNWISLNYENRESLKNDFKYKVIHQLKIDNKVLNIFSGPSPSSDASITFPRNPIYKQWLMNQNNDIQTPTNIFRKEIYTLFLNKNYSMLEELNN